MIALGPHPAHPPRLVRSCHAAVEVTSGAVALVYRIEAAEGALAPVKVAAAPQRRDELWRTTCCELFVKPARTTGQGPAYLEFNFAPGGDWAAYRFDGYRSGMADLDLELPPHVQALTIPAGAGYEQLEVTVHLPWPPAVAASMSSWMAGLTCVIEEVGGPISYWSLRHPASGPDFHSDQTYALPWPPAAAHAAN